MAVDQVQTLWESAQTSLQSFQKTQSESSEALATLTKLQRALEQPKDAILKLSYQPMVFMALKVAHDMGIFPVLAKATTPISARELAAIKPADPLLVERIMRLLVSFDIVQEPSPAAYLPTSVSKEMVNRPVIGTSNPREPLASSLKYTHNVSIDGFTWLYQHPDAMTRFNNFMEGQRANRVHWGDWFPVQERILDGADQDPNRALNVDIGGGRGHDLMLLKRKFPNAKGKLVLEDLPSIIDEAQAELDEHDIEGVKYDFLKGPNPVKGYSKLVIEEYILPDRGADFLHETTDMAVVMFCSGLERTRAQWKGLLESVGLVPTFWVREGERLGVVEGVLPLGNGGSG
ncbi:S-adenosyl-L-methionine-dependent methyltransferase [Aspergillus venezuelensis]